MTLKNALSEDFEDFWETWNLGALTEKRNPKKKDKGNNISRNSSKSSSYLTIRGKSLI